MAALGVCVGGAADVRGVRASAARGPSSRAPAPPVRAAAAERRATIASPAAIALNAWGSSRGLVAVPPCAVARPRGSQPAVTCAGAHAPGSCGPVLSGCGSAVPSHELTNEDLAALVDTSDEWIASRTGISSRRIISGNETLTGLAAEASTKALEMAGVDASEVDLVIMATSSPDDAFGNACLVQAAIGAKKAVAFDLTAACSGFVMATVTGCQYIRAGAYKTVLVIGADALSRYVDWTDRSTCILFGDGAGAVVLQAKEGQDNLLGFDLRSDGAGNRHLTCAFDSKGNKSQSADPSVSGSFDNIAMSGGDVFKFAVRAVPQVLKGAMKNASVGIEDVDWLVLHQANQRILDSAADRMGVPHEKVVTNLKKYGNTSAASIPLALDEAVRAELIKPGDVLAMAGFGAGLSWGGSIVRWGDTPDCK